MSGSSSTTISATCSARRWLGRQGGGHVARGPEAPRRIPGEGLLEEGVRFGAELGISREGRSPGQCRSCRSSSAKFVASKGRLPVSAR